MSPQPGQSVHAAQQPPPQQRGPQVDIMLQRSIEAAQQAAQLQVPCIHALIAKLAAPLPRTSASLSHDLLPLINQSDEYKELSAVMAAATAPVHSISRVVVPDREARFRAWKATLPADLQTTCRVCKHGTSALPCHLDCKETKHSQNFSSPNM